MADLEKLAVDHARWADEISAAKAESSELYCTYEDHWGDDTCISGVFESFQDENKGCWPGDGYSFEEIWDEFVENGEVCANCIRIRELKRKRVAASRRLGAVRAAITKAGRRLAAKEQ